MSPEEYEAQRWRIEHPELVIACVGIIFGVLLHLHGPAVMALACRTSLATQVAVRIVDYAAGGDGRCE